MIDPLTSLGIEKGKPFEPGPGMQQQLNAAALEARTWLDHMYEQMFLPPFYEGTHWALPASPAVTEALSTSRHGKPVGNRR